MPETLGSEDSGILEEELQDDMPDCILVKRPHSGQGLEPLPYPRTRLCSHGDGDDLLLENWTAFL